MPGLWVVVYLLMATLLTTAGCQSWQERATTRQALSLLDQGIRAHISGDPQSAIASYERALVSANDPEVRAAVLGNMGLALLALDDDVGAQSKFEEVAHLTRHAETKAQALTNLGEVLHKRGKTDRARAKYEEALRLTRHPDLQALINDHLNEINAL